MFLDHYNWCVCLCVCVCLCLCRLRYANRHDEGQPDQRPAHDSDWWMDQLGLLWIRHQ